MDISFIDIGRTFHLKSPKYNTGSIQSGAAVQSLRLDDTPSHKAIGYALNQEEALRRFTTDARLPLHNNVSENALRREAPGRKNWLFLGSDDGGEANATFVSLIASCQMHGIEPTAYLRDLFCLLPRWPLSDIIALSPARWQKTFAHDKTQQVLADNVYRQVALGLCVPHDADTIICGVTHALRRTDTCRLRCTWGV